MTQKCTCINSRLFPHRAEKCMFATKNQRDRKSASEMCDLKEHAAVTVAVCVDLDDEPYEVTPPASTKYEPELVNEEQSQQQQSEDAVCTSWTFVSDSDEDDDEEESVDQEEKDAAVCKGKNVDGEVAVTQGVAEQLLQELAPRDTPVDSSAEGASIRRVARYSHAPAEAASVDIPPSASVKTEIERNKQCRCIASRLTPHRQKNCRLRVGLAISAAAVVTVGTVATAVLLASANAASNGSEGAHASDAQCSLTAAEAAAIEEQKRARRRAIAAELAEQRALARQRAREQARLHTEAERLRLHERSPEENQVKDEHAAR
jgi:hypothetical protein